MSIQSNINQGISLMGLLISQNPALREQAEYKADVERTQKRVNNLSEIEANYTEEINKALTEGKTELKDFLDTDAGGYLHAERAVSGEITSARKKLVELDPTAENLEAYAGYAGMNDDAFAHPENYTISPTTYKGQLTYSIGKKEPKTATSKAEDAAERAADAGAAEAARIASSHMYDLSRLHDAPRARVERAIKRAERDTKHLKKDTTEEPK